MKNKEMHIGVVLPKPSITVITRNINNPPISPWTEPSPPANEYSQVFNVEIGNLGQRHNACYQYLQLIEFCLCT